MSTKKAAAPMMIFDSKKQKVAEHSSDDWQSRKSSVKERLRFIFNNERYADVHFIVGTGNKKQRIPAHKLVLSFGSTVFDIMFNSNWNSNEVEVSDIEPETFLSFLKFLYYDHVSISMENASYLLYAAKKYIVPSLEEHCISYVKKNLDASNAFTVLTLAKLYDYAALENTCLKLIDNKAQEAFQSSGFCDIDHELLCSVLGRDSLRIRENDLFQAVIRWCNSELQKNKWPVTPKNQKSVLKDGLYLIRFPLMSVNEFSSGVADSKLLSDKELSEMLLFFVGKRDANVAFSKVPRSSPFLVVNRFSSTLNDYQCSGYWNSMHFHLNQDLLLVGIGMYRPTEDSGSFTVSLEVTAFFSGWCAPSPCLASVSSTVQNISSSTGASKTFHLLLDSPLLIRSGFWYIAKYAIKGANTIGGESRKLQASVRIPDSNEKVTIHFNKGFEGDGCQLPELLFSPV